MHSGVGLLVDPASVAGVLREPKADRVDPLGDDLARETVTLSDHRVAVTVDDLSGDRSAP